MAGKERIDEEKAFKLWNNGLLDKEIAKELGCSTGPIGKWRKRNEFPSNVHIFKWDKGYTGDKRSCAKCN